MNLLYPPFSIMGKIVISDLDSNKAKNYAIITHELLSKSDLEISSSKKDPILKIDNIDYYAVDHTPSYLWESASRSISAALIVYLPTILKGSKSWMEDATIERAINIQNGVVKKASVLTFQNRMPNYPHNFIVNCQGLAIWKHPWIIYSVLK